MGNLQSQTKHYSNFTNTESEIELKSFKNDDKFIMSNPYDTLYRIKKKQITRNLKIELTDLYDSIYDALELLINNPKSSLINNDKAHFQCQTTLENFNQQKYRFNGADLASQIKITSKTPITPKLYFNNFESKQLICNFKLVRNGWNKYVYQAEYFNDPNGYDVLIEICLYYGFIVIELEDDVDIDYNDIQVQYIGTVISLSKRRALALAHHCFMYPKRTLTYEYGIMKVQEKNNCKDDIENDYDLISDQEGE